MIVQFNVSESFNCSFDQSADLVVDYGKEIPIGDYESSYSVTPSKEKQVMPTANRTLSQNIIVEPIPNNYGLIEWNGSTLTVS